MKIIVSQVINIFNFVSDLKEISNGQLLKVNKPKIKKIYFLTCDDCSDNSCLCI